MRIAARLLAAGCLSVLLVLSGCKGDSSENFVASAKSFIAKGDYPAAVIQLKNALQAAPEDAEVRYLLGSSLRNSGDPAAAEIELRKALALGYDVNLTVPELFRALVEQGAGRKIRDEASGDRVTTNAAKAEVTAVKAEVHFMGREFEQARAGYGEAMKLDPANARARIGQVRMAIFDGRLDEAQTLVDQILATSPESVEALQIKGDLFSNDGKKAEAIQTWNEAIKIKPNALNVYLALIPALVRNKDLDGATAQVATLKKTAPGAPPTIYLDALVTFSKGNAKEARELARQLLKVSPDYIPGLLLAGSIEHDLQNYLQAEEHLQKVVSALPEQAYPRRLLVSTFLRSGNLAKAKESLAILSKLAPDEPSTLMLIGEVALASKDGATAARNFEKAAKRAPDNVSVQTRLAQANLLKGDVEQAIDMLEAASAADSIHSEADITLISHYLQARDFTKAQQAADALVRKQPSSAPAIATKGLVQLAHRDYDNARKSFESALQLDPTFVPAARSLAALDLRDKKVDSAKQRYRDLLARDPKQVSAALQLAAILQQTAAPRSEIDRVLADAVNADPSSAPARVARVNYLLATDRAKEALDAALSAQSAIPDDMRVLESLAQAQKANNNFSQAVVTFGKLAALLPRSPGPLIGQAEAYIADKDWIGARGALQKAVALNPNDASNQLFLINTIAGSGQPDAARAAARALQKAQPKSAMGYIAEAGVFSSQGQSAEAENVLRSAMKTVDEPVLAIQLVGLLLRDKRTKDAEAVVSQWTEKHPKDQTVRLAVAEASLSAKNFELSSRMYRSLLRGAPDDPVFMNNLAWALGQTGDPEALSLAVKAAAKAPSNPAILETLGQLQLSAGESAKAIQTLTKATELAPANAVLRLSLARAHAKLGQKNEARAQIEIIRNLIAPATVRQDADALLKTL